MSDSQPVAGERLKGLQAEYDLETATVEALAALLAVIERDPFAPTTIRDPTVGVDRHIADSLAALHIDQVRSAKMVVDLGAGAGLPGLVLAAVLPDARVSLVESNGRKCEFISRAIAAMGLDNAVAVNERAEAWLAGRGMYDVATARAVAPLPVIAEYAAPLLRLGGLAVAWVGRRDPEAEADCEAAAGILGLLPDEPVQVHSTRGAEHRYLYVMLKVRDTPSDFPRRPGFARKRPLGRAAAALGRSGRGSDHARR